VTQLHTGDFIRLRAVRAKPSSVADEFQKTSAPLLLMGPIIERSQGVVSNWNDS